MLFNYTIKNWGDWGKVFQSIADFTPLAREIFRREKLKFASLENLTPGTNAVFRGGDYVVKIFAPQESGFDSQADYLNESAVCGALTEWGIPTPRLIACGSVQDRYLFYYIVPFPKKQTQKKLRKPNEAKEINQPAQSGKQNAREPATPKQSGDANDYKKPQCTQKCRPEPELGKQNAAGE